MDENNSLMSKQQELLLAITNNICDLFKTANSAHSTNLEKLESNFQTAKNYIISSNKRLNKVTNKRMNSTTIGHNEQSKEISNAKRRRVQKSMF